MLQVIVVTDEHGLYDRIDREMSEERYEAMVTRANSFGEAVTLLEREQQDQTQTLLTDRKGFEEIKPLLAPEEEELLYAPEKGDIQSELGFVRMYVRLHLKDDLSLAILAKNVGLSPNYLCSMFKKGTGISIQEFIEKSRMERAAYLLETEDTNIGEIASRTGYRSSSYFARVFKDRYGMSPSRYRRMHKII